MAGCTVQFEARAQKALQKMDKGQANYILAWVRKNLVGTEDPRRYGKALRGDRAGVWRYRIGDYRIIAHIADETVTILVLAIGHGSDVYKR